MRDITLEEISSGFVLHLFTFVMVWKYFQVGKEKNGENNHENIIQFNKYFFKKYLFGFRES